MKFKGNSLLNKLKQKGYSSDDIPRAILFHEFLGMAMLALTWSYCYFNPPSQSTFLQGPIASLKSRVPQTLANKLAENGFLSSRLGSSYVESSCLRKIIRPLTLPSKIFLTFKFVDISARKSRIITDIQAEHKSKPISFFTNLEKNLYSQSSLI